MPVSYPNSVAFILLFATRLALSKNVNLDKPLPNQPKAFPCPAEEIISPCLCTVDTNRITLDCTLVISQGELEKVFSQEFPVPELYEFRVNKSDVIYNLDFSTNGISFQRLYMNPGPFPLLDTVTETFFTSSARVMDYIYFNNAPISNFPFSSLQQMEALTSLYLRSMIAPSMPTITSDTLNTIQISDSGMNVMAPGGYLLHIFLLQLNNLPHILESGWSWHQYDSVKYISQLAKITLVCIFDFFLPTDEFPIDLDSFLDAEFKNDVRFSQSSVISQIIDLKSRKIDYFSIIEGL